MYQTLGQWNVFLAMLFCGMVLGAWYDLMRRLSRLVEPGPILNAVFDVLTAAGMLLIMLFALLRADRLTLRFFSLLASGLGMALYLTVLPPAVDLAVHCAQKAFLGLFKFHNLKKIFQFLFK